jgi:hypothetical protein
VLGLCLEPFHQGFYHQKNKVVMSFFIFPVTIKIDFLQKEKLKEQFGDVKSAIEHGSAYRVLRSVFPTAPRPKLSEQVKLIQRNFSK